MGKKNKTPKPDADGILRTGIYQRHDGPRQSQTPEEFEAGLDRMVAEGQRANSGRLQEICDSLKSLAIPFLEGPLSKGDIDYRKLGSIKRLDFGNGPQVFRELDALHNGSIEANQAHDAIQALQEIETIKACFARNAETSMLMMASVKLGGILARVKIRPFEHPARVGRDLIASANRMRPQKTSKEELRQEAYEKLEQAKLDYPNRGLTTQKKYAAESLGIALSALYARLQD